MLVCRTPTGDSFVLFAKGWWSETYVEAVSPHIDDVGIPEPPSPGLWVCDAESKPSLASEGDDAGYIFVNVRWRQLMGLELVFLLMGTCDKLWPEIMSKDTVETRKL
jgi:hypothetical protein